MGPIFSVTNNDGELIILNYKQWKHIAYRHPEMVNRLYQIENTIKCPDYKKSIGKEIKCYKYIKEENKYLMVRFRLLNKHGFVITAYTTGKIEK